MIYSFGVSNMSDEKKKKVKTIYDILNEYYYDELMNNKSTEESHNYETEHRSDRTVL